MTSTMVFHSSPRLRLLVEIAMVCLSASRTAVAFVILIPPASTSRCSGTVRGQQRITPVFNLVNSYCSPTITSKKVAIRKSLQANTVDEDTATYPTIVEAKKDEVTPFLQMAFSYFNNSRFIPNEMVQLVSAQYMATSVEFNRTVADFYKQAWEMGGNNEGLVGEFFSDNIVGCKQKLILEDFNKWKEDYGIGIGSPDDVTDDVIANLPRMVDVGFQIKDSPLSHQYDLDCFSNHVDHVFKWQTNDKEQSNHVGPFFCFVQSSGMGKTKLLYEYKQMSSSRSDPVASFLILLANATLADEDADNVFDYTLKLDTPMVQALLKNEEKASLQRNKGQNIHASDSEESEKQATKKRAILAANSIFDELDDMLVHLLATNEKNCQKIALLFDESQEILKDEFGYDAFRFRCIRLWLREKPNEVRGNKHIVAVFTGTNSRFTNYLVGTDSELKRSPAETSRDLQTPEREYYYEGSRLYSPFYRTTTTGSCLYLLEEISRSSSDYSRAVCYGRPLFALMSKNGILEENLSTILRRMLCAREWKDARNAWINLLSTRIQAGQTSANVASDLVAIAYANFCGYNDQSRTVHLGYFPDPVCARLAMCMMDEDYVMEVPLTVPIEGQGKKWWTERLKDIFSSGIVSPEKGDVGEVVVALYMLFCGDLLRKSINNRANDEQAYTQFSVPLDAWLQLLLSGGGDGDEVAFEESNVSVGFIQVCRNSLRSYANSWKRLKDQPFLKHIYESGIAFYTYPDCPQIDMVVPLRIGRASKGDGDGEGDTFGEFEYVPMVISIKCRKEYGQAQAQQDCDAMKERAKNDNLSRALCLLIVLGSDTESQFSGDIAMNELERVSDLVVEGVVAKAIRIPKGDVFGLSAAINDMVPIAQVDNELLASHPFIMAHGPDTGDNEDDEVLKAETALRYASSKTVRNDYTALRTALSGSTKPAAE